MDKTQLFPRGIEVVSGAIIRNSERKILLTKSPKWKDKWVIPGGHIEPGETILAAALREAEEETGLALKPVKILSFGELIDSTDFHRPAHFIFFDCIFDLVSGTISLNDELSEYQWLDPKAALQLELGDSFRETLIKYISEYAQE